MTGVQGSIRRSAIYLGALFALGCSPSLELVAHSVEDRSDTAGYLPLREGDRLLAVEVTLTNRTGSTLQLSPALFSLEPASGASVSGNALTFVLADGCGASGTLLSPDRDIRCRVAFDVGAAFEPSRIAYEFDGRRAVAAVMVTPQPDGGYDAGRPMIDAGPVGPTRNLDLLFMVDNSNSMSEEQGSLAAELPSLISILASGDFNLDGNLTDPEDFDPVSSLNVAVISSDMGTAGYTVPTCTESDFGDDGIFRTEGQTGIAGCVATYPSILSFAPPDDTVAFAQDLACVASIGTGGCGFEQQLEAILKSVTPAAAQPWTSPSFVSLGTPGAPDGLHRAFLLGGLPHGAGANAGFSREDAVLAIVPFTDEEDCSAHDGTLFDPSGGPYAGVDLNLRCFSFGADALHPIERYAAGLLQLRRSASRVVYAPIAGIPADLAPAPGQAPDWDQLVSDDPALRDDRMEERIDTTTRNSLVPSCNVAGRGAAFPPVRIVRVAETIAARGGRVTVQSICQDSYASAMRAIVAQVRDAMAGTQ